MTLRIKSAGAVRTLTLDRVEKRNAFDVALADALAAALEEADRDEGVSVAVLASEGPVFSAGADLSLFVEMGKGHGADSGKRSNAGGGSVGNIWRNIADFSKPILVAVQGPAVGMGVTMLPHFDGIYAARSATFALPFVRLGLIQELASSWTLPRLIGHARAMEWIGSARTLDAETLERWGFVTRVFEDAELLDSVHGLAVDMARAPLAALRDAKRLLRYGGVHGRDDTAAEEDRALAKRYGSPENVAAVQAILSRRSK